MLIIILTKQIFKKRENNDNINAVEVSAFDLDSINDNM